MTINQQIGQLEILPIRTAFAHEALDFTTWLEDNIEALSSRVSIELNVLERERAVGPFSVDLVCEDEGNNLVIVENQLERTDHDHLGKLLTYMINLDAKTAIWVTPEVRPEHQRVIDWLNETTGADMSFYLVRVEAARIAASPIAPLFTVVARPSEEVKEIGKSKKEWATRHHQRLEFWTGLLEKVHTKGIQLHANRSPSRDHWLSTGAGKGGIVLNYLILKDGAGIDLYIDVNDQDRNKDIFDALLADKAAIETEFGEELDWRRLDDKRASRIVKVWHGQGSINEPETWPQLQDMMIDAMLRFDKAIRKRLRRIKG